jgi:Excalibur calcium-binding domain
MKNIIIVVFIVFLLFKANESYEKQQPQVPNSFSGAGHDIFENNAALSTNFKCDGRTHCSQMTSCDEAIFFLQNCPNVEMDGNNDGEPCEKQWCN